ncbi:uncharacterized protein LOC116349635, partial [Contarinia nasturtii]|uniref:uncharacterized protein LOC116349635 n=1 Tax=Contarinia nasturtii TaxID=265458 RepID=UPI0012D445EE
MQWEKVNIPIIYTKKVLQRTSDYFKSYQTLKKTSKNRDTYETLADCFKVNAAKLFDIASCKCEDENICACPDGKKVPTHLWRFIIDQRTVRRLSFRSIPSASQDPGPSNAFNANIDVDQPPNYVENENDSNDATEQIAETESFQFGVNLRSGFVEYKDDIPKTYNKVELKQVALIADRYNISDRAAAAIASATLYDFSIITPENTVYVIDRYKIRRSRKRTRTDQIGALTFDNIEAVYFDGRKDDTLCVENGVNKIVKEEHISIVQEPNSLFIGHKAVKDGTAISIANAIDKCLVEKSIPIRQIKGLGCDSTAVNTGHQGGVIRVMEEKFNKALQWIICLLHINELPLRSLITKLDGTTTGPKSFAGPL